MIERKIRVRLLKLSEEFVSSLPVRDALQLNFVIIGNVLFMVGFLLLGAMLFLQGVTTVGIAAACAASCFVVSLVLIKKEKLYPAVYISTCGIMITVFIILFLTGSSITSFLYYRNACFIVTMAVCNQIIAIRRKQLFLFLGGTSVLWFASFALDIKAHLQADTAGTIAAMCICTLAIYIAQRVILLMDDFNNKILNSAIGAERQATDNLSAITKVIDESKAGFEVGKRLYDETQKAGGSIGRLDGLYSGISKEAEELSKDTVTISESSGQVRNQAEIMKDSFKNQQEAITVSCEALSSISESLSRMSMMAGERRENMKLVVENLEGEKKLVKRIVEEVNQVEASSNDIAGFVMAVDSIAAQTGLLAMNASIEAAHAGENGKGFSVIAQEIRKLSDQAASNAKMISDGLARNVEIVREATSTVSEFESFTQNTTAALKNTISAIENILSDISGVDGQAREVMDSILGAVEESKKTSKIVDVVVSEIENQDFTLEKISKFAEALNSSVSGMNTQLVEIKRVVENIESEAEQNISVSEKITSTLNL